jgi:Bacterial Ig-like domain (group 2)
MRLRRDVPILVGLVLSWACPGCSSNSTTPSSAVSSIAVSGSTSLSSIGQTVQLTATATFSDQSTQNVTATAAWQSSNSSVATVTSGGLVTALASGTVTITATYQGKAGTATVPISISPSSRGSMTAIIDGVPFTAIAVSAAKTAVSGLPSGVLSVGGTNAVTSPYLILDFTIPAEVGIYQLGPGTVPSSSLHQNSTTTSMIWGTLNAGGSGTVTLTGLTSTSATGTFLLNLAGFAASGATGTKLATNGVFSVTF